MSNLSDVTPIPLRKPSYDMSDHIFTYYVRIRIKPSRSPPMDVLTDFSHIQRCGYTDGATVAVYARQSGKNRELADRSFLVASFHQKTGVTQLPFPMQICNLEENKI